MDLWPLVVEYNEIGEMIPKLPASGNRLCVLMTHDESTFSANDGHHQACHNERLKQTYLKPKARGRGIMLSDVLFAN